MYNGKMGLYKLTPTTAHTQPTCILGSHLCLAGPSHLTQSLLLGASPASRTLHKWHLLTRLLSQHCRRLGQVNSLGEGSSCAL